MQRKCEPIRNGLLQQSLNQACPAHNSPSSLPPKQSRVIRSGIYCLPARACPWLAVRINPKPVAVLQSKHDAKRHKCGQKNKLRYRVLKAIKSRRSIAAGRQRYALALTVLLLSVQRSMAQADGDAGISEATSLIKGYFNTGVNLMYAIGAVVGLIGAIKVYNKWSAGEPDTTRVASSWFGACIFLVVVATVLKSFFSV